MNIISYLFQTIKQNKIFLIIIFVFVLIASYIHFKNQKISFTSSFITSNGKYNPSYLSELIIFNSIDSSDYNININQLNEYKNTLSSVSINCLVSSQSYIKINLNSETDLSGQKNNIQQVILHLLNTNNHITNLNTIILDPQLKKKEILTEQIRTYSKLLDTLSILKNLSKYIKIEKRLFRLKKNLININEELNSIGKFHIITPIKKFTSKPKPLFLFVFLYLFLGGIIFVMFSKKPITPKTYNE